ncbi:MAG: hypothetical protein U1E49_00630 [Hyphomicrobiaceae bacterium]
MQSPAPVLPSFPTDTESVAGTVTDSSTLGVAVLDVGIDGLQCAEGRVVLARADGAQFVTEREVVLPTTYAGRPAVEAVELTPGTYHVVHYTCRNGANVTYAGAPADGTHIPWNGRAWSTSLASFTVGPGAVADVGRLSLKRTGGGLIDLGGKKNKKGKKGFATASVAALSPGALQRLETERPDLAQRRTAGTMTLGAQAEIKVDRCHLVAEADATAAKPVSDTKAAPAKKKKGTSLSAIGGSMLSTSFAGPAPQMSDCVAEGGKSDAIKAVVGDAVENAAGEGASGQ